MQIKDRTFIVTGGSSGLGGATVKQLVDEGAYVSILDLNPPLAEAEIDNAKTIFTKTDVSSTASLEAAVKQSLEFAREKSAPLAGVVCCAGIGTAAAALPRQPQDATADNVKYYDMKVFDRTLAINLRGTVDLIRLTLPHMSLNEPFGDDDERGVVIVVSSVAAYEGQVGQLAYSASKGAVSSIVLPLARELGQKAGIRVMGIAPGVFQTGMTSRPKPQKKDGVSGSQKPKSSTASKASFNQEMVQYPTRMGQGSEFARLCKEIIENPMLNGFVIRLDGAVRMPSRL